MGVPLRRVHPLSYQESEWSEMRNVTLTEHEKEGIYTMHCLGESKDDISQRYGIARSTVYRIISEQRKKQEMKQKEGDSMAARSKVVAGDKTNGRLTSTTDPHRFEGTCTVGGKSKSKTFTAVNAKNAQQQWEKWCRDLRDEQAFMDMVERKDDSTEHDGTFVAVEKEVGKVVCGAPDDPIEEIRPIKPVEIPGDEPIYEAQQEIDANTEKYLEATGVPLAYTSEPAYLIWAKSPEPRCYGLYLTMESALAEVDKLNDVAKFLGSSGAFEVEEVAWKG